jgi:hypothetical protein
MVGLLLLKSIRINEEEFLEFPNSIWWYLSPEKRGVFCDRINRCMASEQVETRDHLLSWLPLWVLLRRKLANYIISLSRLSDTLVVEIVCTWFCINDPLPVSLLGGLNWFVSLGMKLSCSRSQRSWWEEMSVSYFSYIMIWKITGYYLFYSEGSPLTPSRSSRHYSGNPAKKSLDKVAPGTSQQWTKEYGTGIGWLYYPRELGVEASSAESPPISSHYSFAGMRTTGSAVLRIRKERT